VPNCFLGRFLLGGRLLFVDVFGAGRGQPLVDFGLSSPRHRVPPGSAMLRSAPVVFHAVTPTAQRLRELVA